MKTVGEAGKGRGTKEELRKGILVPSLFGMVTKDECRSMKPERVVDLIDSLMRFTYTSGCLSMSRLDSVFSLKLHPHGSANLCRSLPGGSIASPFQSR